jgi:hypothetical protein
VPKSNKLALLIGIDIYFDRRLKRLNSCKRDVQNLFDLLTSETFDYRIFGNRPIIGSELDRKYGWANIRKIINNFFTSAKAGETLLFYFSGHGIPFGNEVFLGTPSVDPKNPSETGFALSELTRLMGWSKSRQIVGVIDACHSGAADLPNTQQKKITKKNAGKHESQIMLAKFDRVWRNTPMTPS